MCDSPGKDDSHNRRPTVDALIVFGFVLDAFSSKARGRHYHRSLSELPSMLIPLQHNSSSSTFHTQMILRSKLRVYMFFVFSPPQTSLYFFFGSHVYWLFLLSIVFRICIFVLRTFKFWPRHHISVFALFAFGLPLLHHVRVFPPCTISVCA